MGSLSPDVLDGMSIWKRALRKHLERGGPLKKMGDQIGQTLHLSHSKQANQISSARVEPVGYSFFLGSWPMVQCSTNDLDLFHILEMHIENH